MTAAVSKATETLDERGTEASEGDHDLLTIDHLDVILKQTPILPVATIEREKERTDIQDIEETSESGTETEVIEDRSETVGETTVTDRLEESETCLMIEEVVDEEGENVMRFKGWVGIERRAQPHHRRRRSPLLT